MRRLTLLILALSLAVVAPAAAQGPGDRDGDGTPDTSDNCPDQPGGYQGCPPPPDRDGDGYPDSSDQCPDAFGGSAYQGCPPPSDRDGDGTPDSSDACPDAPGSNSTQGCPPPPDRDGDAIPDSSDRCPDENGPVNLRGCSADADGDNVLDIDDKCPGSYGKQADGCERFVWRYFFGTQSLKDFAADKPNDTTYCSSGLTKCKRTHATFTLSAATAKAAGIKKRRIGSLSVAVPSMGGFDRGISRAHGKKLAKLKRITVTIRAWVILASGKKVEAAPYTVTIKGYASHQFNSDNTDGDVV